MLWLSYMVHVLGTYLNLQETTQEKLQITYTKIFGNTKLYYITTF